MGKREIIIESAMRLFVSQGFENTPTAQISKEAGVATGTLFYHFENKEELINEVYIYVKKDMSQALFKNYDRSVGVKNRIKLIWDNLILWGFRNREKNAFLQKFYGSIYIDKLTIEELHSLFEIIEEVFSEAKEKNMIKEISFDLFGKITMSLSQSFLFEFYNNQELDVDMLEFSFKIYWDAVGK